MVLFYFHPSPLHTCTRWVSNWIAHLIAVFRLNVDHSGAVSIPCALQPHVERKISSCSRVGSCKASHYSRPNAENARIQNRCFMCRKKQFSICSPPAVRDEKFAGNLRYHPFVSNELLLSSSFTRHAGLKFTRNIHGRSNIRAWKFSLNDL